MRKLLLLFLLFVKLQGWSQGQMIVVTSLVPNQLTVCGESQVFKIFINNPTLYTITNDTLKITMPTGILYQANSITGGTFVSNFGGILIVWLPNILPYSALTITYKASAQCSVIAYIAGGGITKNNIRVDYTGNNIRKFCIQNTSAYLIKQPHITISAVTNQSYSGNIGDVFTRCIKIVNFGNGALSAFTLTDTHGSGIQINSVDYGTLSFLPSAAKIILSGADFYANPGGDGDSLFENGESITICESVTVLNCYSVYSNFNAYWSCSMNACQSSTSTANVVFPNYIPNLVITSIPSMNSCIGPGNASLQQLKIINKGLGNAINVLLDIFQSTGAGYNNTVGSEIDAGSFTIQTGAAGTPAAITTSNLAHTNSLNCMVSAIGKLSLTVPSINAGDTIYIKWNTYSCCFNSCTNTGRSYINGWRYKGSYQNICQGTYVIAETWGRVYSNIYGALANNGSISSFSDGQTGTFDFLFSNYGNSYPAGPGAHWKFVFTLPGAPCLTYSNIKILSNNGVTVWNPSSTSSSGNTVTAVFNGPPPFTLSQAEVKIDLTLNCADCAGVDSVSAVKLESFYVPNNTCGCEIGVSCISVPLNINCPSPCVGLVFTKFTLKRTSYGLPDNLNANNTVNTTGGDGLPDAVGSLDFTKIKTLRAMFGDTITASFNGRVKTSPSYPEWHYCFASSSMSNGNRLAFLDAAFKIYRGGNVIAACNNFSTPGNPEVTNAGTNRIFRYNLSDTVLGTCIPGGFAYLNDDSLVFEPRYKVISNIGNSAPLVCNSSNEYYLSDIPAFPLPPTPAANKFQCGTYNGSCSIVGYFFRNYGSGSYYVNSCNNITISQDYYLSIGPNDNNYGGGNLFPYEYRNWAHINTLTAAVPSGYTVISSRFNQVRTAGTLVTVTDPLPSHWQAITPLNPNSDTLVFPVEQYFQGYGGTIPLSDDGFHGTLEITLEPSCKVTPSISHDIIYDWTFSPTISLTGPGSDAPSISQEPDDIVYDPPVLFLQSVLPSVFALNTTVSWDVSISNTSNVSDAVNTWLSGPAISGVSIIQVVDLGTGLTISPINTGIYPVGTVNAMATRNFRITASFISCAADSVILYSGWNCFDGYPANVNTYPCTPQKITLTETPLTPAFVINSTGPSFIQLCDTAEYTTEVVNVQLGTGYNIVFRATLPAGTILVPGSSKLSYPVLTPYFTISDPVPSGVNTWEWNISASDSLIGIDGLKGLLDDSLNKFKISFKVFINPDCSYSSGGNIYFVMIGQAACGASAELDVSISPALNIIGASVPYNTGIVLNTAYVSPCSDNSTMYVTVHNAGGLAFGSTDSVLIKLPAGIAFADSTFVGIYNAPVNGNPRPFTLNGDKYLVWALPVGIQAGDSTLFSFDYSGDPIVLSCGIVFFEAKTSTVSVITCAATGNSCTTDISTGDTTLAVFTYKAYPSLSNGSAIAIPNPPGGETVALHLDITNTGQEILTNADSIIQFYFDADGNGIYSTGDVFLIEDTVFIPRDTTVPYSITFNVPAGQACSIIAVIDPAVNPCVCNPSQLVILSSLINSDKDSTVCSGQVINLGSLSVPGYTYSWTPPTGLSDAALSNPVLTTSNTNAVPVSTDYIFTSNRMNCISKDTVTITVNPIPASNAGADIITCASDSSRNIGTASNPDYTYQWIPSFNLSDTAISNPSVTLINPDTTTYIVITSSLSCFSSDTILVMIKPIPVSHAGIDILTCSTSSLGNIGTASNTGYTYLWSPGTGLSSISVSNPTVALVDSSITDYIVTTSANGCFSSDTVLVTVNPLPTAYLTGTAAVCKDSSLQQIIFTGASGTPPYTFTYSVDGGTNQTITTTSGDTVSISMHAYTIGTTIYRLVSVQDSSITACSQIQNDSAVLTVNPLPTASISGTVSLCRNSASPNITFTGALGTAPYTFTYSINNGTSHTVNSTSGGIAAVSVSTDTAGVFVYSLISVHDSSSTVCSQAQTGSATVRVNSLPIANFGFADVCLNHPMNFTDSSIVLNDTISGWLWDFGDSSAVITVQNSNHTYTSAGTYSVLLISTTNNGCKDTIPQTVTVHPLPNAQFYTTPESIGICKGTVVEFNDSSTIAAPDVLQSWTWNFGDASPAVFSQDTSHLYAAANSYNVILAVASNFGCSDSIPRLITINPKPIVNFTENPAAGCEPLCISFSDSSTVAAGSNTHWIWDVGDGNLISNSQNFEHCYTNDSVISPVSFNISLTVTSDSGCVSTLSNSNYITVYPNPVAGFSVDPETTTVMDPVFSFVNLSTGAGFWNWNFGDLHTSAVADPPPHVYPPEIGTYVISLITSTQYGCKDTAYQTIFIDADFVFYIPNAFTPNDDGINDYFFGTGIGIIKYEIVIFDRWGNMIFRGNDLNDKWDGRANGGQEAAQMDVYVWKVKLTDVFNKEHKYIGKVTLVK